MCRDRCEIELRHGRHIVFDFHSATERRSYFAVHFVGKAIEAEMKAEIAAKPIAKQPADPWKVETAGRTSEMFTAVRDFDDLARERFRSALRKAGRGPSTRLTFSVRWEDAMRLMAGEWLNGRGEHSLDWFHLRRRIEWLGRSIHWAVDYGDRDGMAKLTRNRRNLRSPRWNLWHYGGSRHARWMIALSHLGAQLRSDRNVLDGVNDTRHLGGNGCERLAPEIRIVAILGDVALEFVSKSVLSLADRNLSSRACGAGGIADFDNRVCPRY